MCRGLPLPIFGIPIGLYVLDLGPMYVTDRRQTKASLNAFTLRWQRHNKSLYDVVHGVSVRVMLFACGQTILL